MAIRTIAGAATAPTTIARPARRRDLRRGRPRRGRRARTAEGA